MESKDIDITTTSCNYLCKLHIYTYLYINVNLHRKLDTGPTLRQENGGKCDVVRRKSGK